MALILNYESAVTETTAKSTFGWHVVGTWYHNDNLEIDNMEASTVPEHTKNDPVFCTSFIDF